jgi:Trp operon repressor
MMNGKKIEHSFSVEMKDKHCVNKMNFINEAKNQILLEGYLGELKSVSMTEDVMLEIEGVNGLIRLDITQQELKKYLSNSICEVGGTV